MNLFGELNNSSSDTKIIIPLKDTSSFQTENKRQKTAAKNPLFNYKLSGRNSTKTPENVKTKLFKLKRELQKSTTKSTSDPVAETLDTKPTSETLDPFKSDNFKIIFV